MTIIPDFIQRQTVSSSLSKKKRLFCLLCSIILSFFLCSPLLSHDTDFDCVFVGTSPISILEALYRSYSGERVLILEADDTIGGSWKTVHVCDIADVDMGCHQIGRDPKLVSFLENQLSCDLVPMNQPSSHTAPLQTTDQGLYFSRGCNELIQKLARRLQESSATLLLNHKLKSIFIDFEHLQVIVKVNEKQFTTLKVILTPHSQVEFENYPDLQTQYISKHYHLYLLIEDLTYPKFTYYQSFCSGMSRTINLTPFSTIEYPKQLIAIQTINQESLEKAHFYHEQFIQKGLLDPTSRLIKSDIYIYEQAHFNPYLLQQKHPEATPFFELLGTEGFWNIVQYAHKWETVFKQAG